MSVLTITSRPTRNNVDIPSEVSRWNAVWHPIMFAFQAPDDLFGSPAKSFYFIEVKILEYSTGVPLELTSEYARFRPDTNGVIKADLQAWLQTMLSARNLYNYGDLTAKDDNLSAPFNIQYREYWKEAGFSAWSALVDDNLFYVSNSVRKVGIEYGQNMLPYVMFPTDLGSPKKDSQKGKFLTRFAKPKYYENYPFDLQFIYSKEIIDAGQRIFIVEKTYDINRNLLGTTETLVDNNNGYIIRARLQGGYSSNVDTIDFYLIVKKYTAGTVAQINVVPSLVVAGLFNFSWITNIPGVGTITVLGEASKNAAFTDIVGKINTLFPTIINGTWDGTTFHVESTDKSSAGNAWGWSFSGSGVTINPPGSGAFNGGSDGSYSDATGATTNIISEVKTIKNVTTCVTNPLYLSWLNPDGGWDYWMFEFNQDVSDTIKNIQSFEQYIENLDQAEGRGQALSKDIQEETIIAAENLSQDELEGLRYLLGSIKVSKFIQFIDQNFLQADQGDFIQTDGGDYIELDQGGTFPQWETQEIDGGTFGIKSTIEARGRIELTIKAPQKFNQQQ